MRETSSAVLRARYCLCALALCAVCVCMGGCESAHGRPGPAPEVPRPDQVTDFPTLFSQNCSGCHGANGKNGAAISLANPVYVNVAGEAHIKDTITHGVNAKLMPAFAKSAGGPLTQTQVAAIAHGIAQQWGNPNPLAGQNAPPYAATLTGSAERGLQAYGVYCARCHGANGEGGPADGNTNAGKPGQSAPGPGKSGWVGSIVDPSYLALLSDQDLRSITIAGRPDEAMPDYRNDATQPMADQQVTDIVAWLASKRVANPGQPYR